MCERLLFLQAPRLSWSYIRTKAEEFRQKYVEPVDKIPVPIIDITELQLNIHPIPIQGLKERIDIDGFLTRDLKNICIDNYVYEDPRQENRLRFTYAHEVGHLILHEAEIRQCDFRNTEDWIHFHEDFLDDDLMSFSLSRAQRLIPHRPKTIMTTLTTKWG